MDISIDQLRDLPLERRLEIIEALWESVESELGPEAISDELDREFEAHLQDLSSSIPWEQVRAEMRRRFADLGTPAELRLSQAEQAEIDRRLAEHKRNPGAAKPVDTFLNELDGRYV